VKIKAVLLAAGESSRFWPLSEGRHKSTIKICGKPIILWTIESLTKAGIKDFIIVQSPKKEVEEVLRSYALPDDCNLEFVVQEQAKGMGDAVERVKELIEDYFLVLNPNHFDAHEFVLPMIKKLKQSNSDAVLLGRETSEPWNYGVFVFENDKPVGIVEKPEKGKEPSNIRVMGIYLLSKKFFDYHKQVELHEYSYEDALSLLLKNESVELVITDKSTTSLKYTWHLLDFTKKLMEYVINEPKISENAMISEKAEIQGNVIVEEGAKIFENAVIKGPCYIGKNTIIGNNALVRESCINDSCIVGANAEAARSVFLDDVHVHSGYFGDTILSEGVRVGAGTVFANVRLDRTTVKSVVKGKKIDTGRKSFGGVVGRNTRIGINCSIMPGVHIGSNCFIGAATLVSENVPSNTLYYAKFEKLVKERSQDS
jgi:bifunctional UDP-N-acetylglucosamine pyrophosphorylase/glucosamine-1-phosphate N-acetyltransferase